MIIISKIIIEIEFQSRNWKDTSVSTTAVLYTSRRERGERRKVSVSISKDKEKQYQHKNRRKVDLWSAYKTSNTIHSLARPCYWKHIRNTFDEMHNQIWIFSLFMVRLFIVLIANWKWWNRPNLDLFESFFIKRVNKNKTTAMTITLAL